MELDDCLSVFRSDYDACPGKYCSRVLLNDTLCLFSQCQVNFNFFFYFLWQKFEFFIFIRNAHEVTGLPT